MKLQYSLILIFTGLMALILLGINLVMYSMSSGYRKHGFYLSMENSATIVARAVLQQEKAEDYYEIKNSILQHLEDEEEYIIRVRRDKTNLKFPESLPLEKAFYWEAIKNGRAHHYQDGVYYVGLFIHNSNSEDDILVISTARDYEGDAYRKRLKTTLAATYLGALLLMTLTSIFFSKKLFGPMVQIIQKVNSINAFNLNDRLDKEHSLDEISELQSTLNEMLNRIESAFKAQQDYVSNTSHSLRTPLTIIAGEAEIALAAIEPGHKAKHSLQMIMQETVKLKHTVNTLLELVKVTGSGQKDTWKVTRLDEVLHEVLQTVGKMDGSFRLKIDYSDLPENESQLMVSANEHLLSLALSNIILNGFKYSGNKEVWVKLISQTDTIRVRVTDYGIGIPEEEKELIFTPYFRASNTEGFEGFGIGLPLALEIIRMHNGDIQVDSKQGKGTTVMIMLPVAKLLQREGQEA
ncbi:ATP-binding protein [Rufibacter glacialis]|uniref:histidine kinase n=1 Tax=Rufibacter glacialis TaxID=1259555 RepID=A0A5M8QHZ1_9BACT|nr:HAMP domain-containing sensor histidine kinase [Rufibacter glacialis]KAA6434443.1 HAMP domain-containing histidine kinase [Rufibacter glacialis]GGK69674.1 hypothetical protein GCM10011405_17160 [Rufibacter glacialis]